MDSCGYSASDPFRTNPSRSLISSHSLPVVLPFVFMRTSVQRPRSLYPDSSKSSFPFFIPSSRSASGVQRPWSQTMTSPAP